MRNTLLFSFLIFGLSLFSTAQKVLGKLRIPSGSTILLEAEAQHTMTQQAMGQAINYSIDGKVKHRFSQGATSEISTSLHHQLIRFSFSFDGMGQKGAFDSENKADMEGDYGRPVKELMERTYDMTVDSFGRSLSVKPGRIELPGDNKQFSVIMERLRELMSVAYLPSGGEMNIFHVMPDREVGLGDSWTEVSNTASDSATTVSTLTAITDSTLLIDFKTTANCRLRSEVNGVSVSTNLTGVTTGQMTVDRATGLLRRKQMKVETNGLSEVMGTKLPISEKTEITVLVKMGG